MQSVLEQIEFNKFLQEEQKEYYIQAIQHIDSINKSNYSDTLIKEFEKQNRLLSSKLASKYARHCYLSYFEANP